MIYRRVVATTGNPEYVAALADVVARRDAAEAAEVYRQADAAFAERYRSFPAAVAAHYADYLLDHRPDDPRLMELAELDHRVRPNADSQVRLAAACLANGQRQRARELIAEVEASPWRPRRLPQVRRALRTGR